MKSKVNVAHKYIETSKRVTCNNCVTNFLQHEKEIDKNTLLDVFMYNSIHKYHWDISETKTYDISKVIKTYITPTLWNDVDFRFHLSKVKANTINVENKMTLSNYKKRCIECKGGKIIDKDQENEYLKYAIDPPPKGIIGVIKFKNTGDFVIIDDTNYSENEIKHMASNENESISKLDYGGRSGACGGVVYSTTNSHSLSNVTKKPNSILTSHTNGVHLSCSYENNSGDIKSYKSVYNDLLMQRMDHGGKLSKLLNDHILRDVTIKEMRSRLNAYILACHLSLIDEKEVLTLAKLNNIYIENEEYAQRMKLFKSQGHSKYESMLLVWSSTTGEMRNHQSLAAHVDGNKSHCMESLSLFPRLTKQLRKEQEVEFDMVDGFVLCPLDGTIIKYLCGKQLLHCSLSNTLHLSDSSRNRLNWSRVHGP